MNRRRYLRHATAAAVAALSAGCSADDDSPSETEPDLTSPAEPRVRTHRWATPPASLTCDDEGVEPMEAVTEEPFPEQADDLELTASTDTVVIGAEITFSLRNVGSDVTNLDSIHKYALQRRDGDGWSPVYHTDGSEWENAWIGFWPGGGYDWSFAFDSEGLERQNGDSPSYLVCSPLDPGTYRFVHWGSRSPALATQFTAESP
jgi:hypothetical protein